MTEKECFEGEKVIFEWKMPSDHPNFSGHDDRAKEYKVIKKNKADGGIVVFGHYGDNRGWVCNPALRPLVRHLISELLIYRHWTNGLE